MVRSAIESHFRASKMANGGPFCKLKKKQLHIYLKWRENEMAIKNDFRASKMADCGHFVNKFQKQKLRIDLKWEEV